MKAQFAVTEAVISVLVLSALLAIIANSAYTTQKLQSDYKTNYGDALYDFSNLARLNQSPSNTLILELANAYHLSYVRFSQSNSSMAYGSPSTCTKSGQLCYPVQDGQAYTVSCLYICGN